MFDYQSVFDTYKYIAIYTRYYDDYMLTLFPHTALDIF